MKTKSNNKNQNTPKTTKTTKTTKTKPSAEDKALAELVRTKVLNFVKGMKKVCNDNGLSFEISGWVEDPVDRGDTPDKTLTYNCGKGNICQMLVHKIINISVMLQDCTKKCPDEVADLCLFAERLIGYVCKKAMTNLNKKMENDNKSKTKEK